MKKSLIVCLILVFTGSYLVFGLPEPSFSIQFNGKEIPKKIKDVKIYVAGEPVLSEGYISGGLKLNGGEDKLKIYKPLNLAEGAIVFWIKAFDFKNEKEGNEKTIMLNHYTKSAEGVSINKFYVEQRSSKVGARFTGDEGKISTKFKMETDIWYQFAFVWEGAKADLYANGKLIGSAVSEALTDSTAVEFGKCWNGIFDEIKIFDKILKESEIKELYENEKQN